MVRDRRLDDVRAEPSAADPIGKQTSKASRGHEAAVLGIRPASYPPVRSNAPLTLGGR
jgi:hypothetical protein